MDLSFITFIEEFWSRSSKNDAFIMSIGTSSFAYEKLSPACSKLQDHLQS